MSGTEINYVQPSSALSAAGNYQKKSLFPSIDDSDLVITWVRKTTPHGTGSQWTVRVNRPMRCHSHPNASKLCDVNRLIGHFCFLRGAKSNRATAELSKGGRISTVQSHAACSIGTVTYLGVLLLQSDYVCRQVHLTGVCFVARILFSCTCSFHASGSFNMVLYRRQYSVVLKWIL